MEQNPIARFVSDGFDKAKNGEAIAIYNTAAEAFRKVSLPGKSHYAFGWIIFYALHQSADHEITGRKRMLADYLRLDVAIPHKLHSMVLTEAIRLYRDAKRVAFASRGAAAPFSIVRFMDLWGIGNLRPGDWRRKDFEGKTLTSTVEKLITVYVDELEESRKPASADFTAVADHALAMYAGSYNLISQRASLHALANEKEAAVSLLTKAVILSPNKFYLWHRLALLTDSGGSPRLHVALLYKALKSPGPEQFKGRVRIHLAKALASAGAFPQALWETRKAAEIYSANGWHLPHDAEAVARLIPKGCAASDPAQIYKRLEHLADDAVYDSLPAVKVVKTYHKNPPAGNGAAGLRARMAAWRVTDSYGNNYWLTPGRMGIDPVLPMGTEIIVRVLGGKVVKAYHESAHEGYAESQAATPDSAMLSEPGIRYGIGNDIPNGQEEDDPESEIKAYRYY